MGSNVVYNPDTGTWVGKGTSDYSPDLGEPSGKSAYDYQYEKKKEQRKKIGRKRVDRKKKETLEEYRNRLNKKRIKELQEYRQKQKNLTKKKKNILEEVYKEKTAKSIEPQKSIDSQKKKLKQCKIKKQNIFMEVYKERQKKSQPKKIKNPYQSKYYSEDYKRELKQKQKPALKQTGQKPIHQTKIVNSEPLLLKKPIGYREAPKGEKATAITSNPYISGAKKGAKNIIIGGGIALAGATISYLAPPLIPFVAGGGYTLGSLYVGSVAVKAKKGYYTNNPEGQTQLVTEVVGFGALGSGVKKGRSVIRQKRFETKVRKSQDVIYDKKTDWGTKQLQRYEPIKKIDIKNKIIDVRPTQQKTKGYKITTSQKTGTANKLKREYQTQLREKKAVKTSEDFAQATGKDYVYINPLDTAPKTIKNPPIEMFKKLGKGQKLVFQAKTKTGTTKQIFRDSQGQFKAYEIRKGKSYEVKLSKSEKATARELFLTQKKQKIIDLRNKNLKKYITKTEPVKKITTEESTALRMFKNKKAQFLKQSPKYYSKGRFQAENKPRIFRESSITNKIRSKIRTGQIRTPDIIPIISIDTRTNQDRFQIQPINEKQISLTKPREDIAEKPKQEITQQPKQDVSQKPMQDQKQEQIPRQNQQPRFKQPPKPQPPTRPPTRPPTKPIKRPKYEPIPKPKPPKKLKLPKIKPNNNKKQAYEVYIKDGETWKKKGQKQPINKALDSGASYVDNNPEIIFKVSRAGKTTKQDIQKPPLRKFEKNNNKYTEKKKYRNDRIGERVGKKTKWL